jgi:ABC-type multidrug transport system fused ATPase/permease subunit
MSFAKPVLNYIDSLKPKKSFTQSVYAFKRLLRYHRKYVPFIATITVLAVLRSYLFTLEPMYTSLIIDKVIVAGNYDILVYYLMVIFLSGVGFGVTNFFISYVHGMMSQYIVRDIRSEYYSSLQSKSYSFYDSIQVGDLVSRATMDLQMVDGFLRTWIGTVLNAVFSVVAIFVIMNSISTPMTLASLIPMPFIFYFTTKLWVETMPLFRNMQLILGKLGAYIQQNILGMKTVRIFQKEMEVVDGFKKIEQRFVDTAISAGKIQSIYMPLSPAILTLGIAGVYVYSAYSIAALDSSLTIGDIILFARYMIRLTFPLRDLSMLLGTWINASAGLERVFEIIDAPRSVSDLPNAKNVAIKEGKLEFRNVTFGYAKKRPVLRNVSFVVMPGEKVAILGATGSGKSSLVYLVPRFYDVDSGSVLIDGVDVREFKLSSLRKQIGIVLQDVFLFSGTVRSNIAFGKPDASMEEIAKIARMARINEFVESLPEGYESMVGERGATLSGGQKQRITIARALLMDPKILIMDDSLSFVDSKTEKEIQSAIEEAMKGRTTLIIAQRLSTIKNADKILVMENGTIIEFGTHEELIARNGTYKRIYETQFLDRPLDEAVMEVRGS